MLFICATFLGYGISIVAELMMEFLEICCCKNEKCCTKKWHFSELRSVWCCHSVYISVL